MSIQHEAHPPDLLPTGVPGLDEVLGGGIPDGAFTVIGGGTGAGKTTLAQQIAFANASSTQPAVYLAGPGEPADKLRQHLQQLTFFGTDRLDSDVHLVNLGPHFAERDTTRVLSWLEANCADAGLVVVDAPRTLTPPALWSEIVLFLAGLQATRVLLVDLDEPDASLQPTLSMADAVVWLRQATDERAAARNVQVLKVRGQEPLPGRHTLRMSVRGMRVFPRWPTPERRPVRLPTAERLSVGVDGVDHAIGGGLQVGDSVLVRGSSGTGKSILASQFIAECGHQGAPGLVLLFEERPDRFIARAESLNLHLERLVQGGLVDVLSFRGRDVQPDELIHLAERAASDIGARGVVIDSTTGLELLLGGPSNVRDCLWRLLDALCGRGMTVWLNHTPRDGETDLGSLVDNVLELKRIERDAHVERRLEVVKVSANARAGALVAYEIGTYGVQVAEAVRPTSSHIVNYRYATG